MAIHDIRENEHKERRGISDTQLLGEILTQLKLIRVQLEFITDEHDYEVELP